MKNGPFPTTETIAGPGAPLKTLALADRQAALTSDYFALFEGHPLMLIRQITHPDGAGCCSNLLTLAVKPVGEIPLGTQMWTELGYELPVERYAECVDGRAIMVRSGPIVVTIGDLLDQGTKICFDEADILQEVISDCPSASCAAATRRNLLGGLLNLAKRLDYVFAGLHVNAPR